MADERSPRMADRPAAPALVEQHGAAGIALDLDVGRASGCAARSAAGRHASPLVAVAAKSSARCAPPRGPRRRSPGSRRGAGHRRPAAARVTLRSRPSALGGSSRSGVVGRVGQHDLQAVELAQPLGELVGAVILQAIAQPHDVGAGVELHAVDLGDGGGAIGRPRLRPESAQQRARLVGPERTAADRRRVERRGRRADQHDQPALALGALDQPLGMGEARRPARADDQPSSITSSSGPLPGRCGLRVEQRTGEREDQRGRAASAAGSATTASSPASPRAAPARSAGASPGSAPASARRVTRSSHQITGSAAEAPACTARESEGQIARRGSATSPRPAVSRRRPRPWGGRRETHARSAAGGRCDAERGRRPVGGRGSSRCRRFRLRRKASSISRRAPTRRGG